MRLRRTEDPRLDLRSLSAGSRSDVDAVAERVTRHPHARMVTEPELRRDFGGGYGLRFLDCDGRTVEVASDVTTRTFRPVEESDSRPTAISHVVFNTADLEVTRRFYQSVLGFRVSDWVEDFFMWSERYLILTPRR